ncbi:MAG: hypothetical protein J5760_06040 [Clostridia bacterium]|nr:hypothetical protein [Clostridia bacterium]
MDLEELIKEFAALHKEYADSYECFDERVKTDVFRREYAKGGETLHRGFYSPSALDLVVSGSGRGRLLKRTPKGPFSYEYLFDVDDRLICANKYSDFFDGVPRIVETEFLVYERDLVSAFTYDPLHDNELFFISLCRYERSAVIRYETALFRPIRGKNDCIEINAEEFEYENGMMRSDRWTYYFPGMGLMHQDEYSFIRDDGGYITSFTDKPLNKPDKSTYGPYKAYGRRK